MTETSPHVPSAAIAPPVLAALQAGAPAFPGVLAELLAQTGAMLAVKDAASGRYLHVDPALAAFFGRTPQDLAGLTDADLLEVGQSTALRASDKAALAHPTALRSEHRIGPEGQRRDFSVVRVAVPGLDGAPHLLCSLWVDLTPQHQRESQLQQALKQLEQQHIAAEAQRRESQDQALRDGVTGLYQRVHFDDQLRRELDLSSREHREFALVSIELDPPTDAVLALGSGAQTRVLEALGRLLRGNTRAMDASCRLDERHFAVLLSGVGLATAHSRMEGLRRQCATQIVVYEGRELGFTVSMGVASFPHTAHTQEELLEASDHALREARRRGGNHVTLASIRFEPV
jgi:diguanylate cyclase (GGDEF)-like protein